MINWSTDEVKFKKANPEEYRIWRLTQLINYGLDGEKLKESEVKRFWHKISGRIDVSSREYLQFLIWGTRPSSMRINSSF